jgi:phosphopantothenoylcysteine decarboxylase/phosphopantothenate--cysteine ligase
MLGKRILLGISGGIAAYKVAYLIRILKKKGADVRCIMTPASSDFISPLVLSTLSNNPVQIEFWDRKTGVWNNHVENALWADLFVVAPLTANTLSAMAVGSCDNLLLATYLSMKGKTMVAPAMDLDMYAHPTTKRNLESIVSDGVIVIPSETGELASGLEGEGRMAEPENIVSQIESFFSFDVSQQQLKWKNKQVFITAGPTYEAIDPVRFIGNHSSGKMGFKIANEALNQGANVCLVTGPTKLSLTHPNLQLILVKTAEEMLKATKENWKQADIGIFSAAVADYRPKVVATEKIKKSEENLVIELIKNPDILAWAGQNKSQDQILVGFALETNNLLQNSTLKLKNKHLNLIVMNTLQDEGAGFSGDTNKISILDDRNNLISFELKSKADVAVDILETIINYSC